MRLFFCRTSLRLRFGRIQYVKSLYVKSLSAPPFDAVGSGHHELRVKEGGAAVEFPLVEKGG